MPAERNKTSGETRRSNKPLMEKRRRARINQSLTELKTLILDVVKKDPSRHSKLEKADILEMTVKYLQNLQTKQVAATALADPGVTNKFRAGFSHCADEVSRYLQRNEISAFDQDAADKLLGHLTKCTDHLGESSTVVESGTTDSQPQPVKTPPQETGNDVNLANPLLGSVRLIPTRLPTGQLAFILPCTDARTTPMWRPW